MTPYHQEEKASVSTSLITGHIPLLISYPKHTGYPLSLENIQKDNVLFNTILLLLYAEHDIVTNQ